MKDYKKELDYEEILFNLDRAKMLADLKPEKKGEQYILTCPSCKERKAHILKMGYYISCDKTHGGCGFHEDIIDYLKEIKNMNDAQLIRYLGEMLGFSEDKIKEMLKED